MSGKLRIVMDCMICARINRSSSATRALAPAPGKLPPVRALARMLQITMPIAASCLSLRIAEARQSGKLPWAAASVDVTSLDIPARRSSDG